MDFDEDARRDAMTACRRWSFVVLDQHRRMVQNLEVIMDRGVANIDDGYIQNWHRKAADEHFFIYAAHNLAAMPRDRRTVCYIPMSK